MTPWDRAYNHLYDIWRQFKRDHPRGAGVILFLKRVWDEFGADHGTLLAAALAYTALFALFPLLLAVIGVVGFLLAKGLPTVIDVQSYVLARVAEFLPGAFTFVADTLAQVETQRGPVTAWGLFLLVVSGSYIFGQVEYSLDLIFDCPPRIRNPLQTLLARALYAALVLGVALLLLAGILLDTLGKMVNDNVVWLANLEGPLPLATPVFSIVITAFLFGLLFKVLPMQRPPWREVLPGAVLGALLWELGKQILTWYLGRPIYNAVYGPVTGVIVLLSWFYYSALVFLLSAEFSSTLGQVRAERAAQPETRKQQG